MIPLPHLLTKVFISQTKTDPVSVSLAFIQAMLDFDNANNTVEEEQNDPTESVQQVTEEPDLTDDNNSETISDPEEPEEHSKNRYQKLPDRILSCDPILLPLFQR
jgi:hypothetical protein